jgi:hypothetical protein
VNFCVQLCDSPFSDLIFLSRAGIFHIALPLDRRLEPFMATCGWEAPEAGELTPWRTRTGEGGRRSA